MDMNLKDYKMQPEEGLYEKIESRLRLRRMVRVGSMGAAVVVAGVVLWSVRPSATTEPLVAQATGHPAAAVVEVPHSAPQSPDAEGAAVVAAPQGAPLPQGEPLQAPVAASAPLPSAAVPTATPLQTPATTEVAVAAPRKAEVPTVKPLEKQPVATQEPEAAEAEPTADAPAALKAGDPTAAPVHIDNLVWAPNAIAPNGDVDENRRFKLSYFSAVSDFRIHIYNRGGRLVYTSVDPTFEWDGTSHGTLLPQGAYVWVARFRNSEGRLCQEKGTVTIVR